MRPFVMVGMPRTGSTLLQRVLQQHPAVLTFGELFHSLRSERIAPQHAMRRNGAIVVFDETNGKPMSFLNDWVWCASNENFRAVGFKVFASDSVADISPDFFSELRVCFPDIHVIHIHRDNYLDVLVSRRLAEKTGEWFLERGVVGHESDHKLTLSVDEVLAHFEKLETADSFLHSTYSGGHYLSVGYDNLSQDLQGTADRVFEFLGVDSLPVTATISKQVNRRVSEVITNYPELWEYFRDTRFAHCFSVQPEASQPLEQDAPQEISKEEPVRAWMLTRNHKYPV